MLSVVKFASAPPNCLLYDSCSGAAGVAVPSYIGTVQVHTTTQPPRATANAGVCRSGHDTILARSKTSRRLHRTRSNSAAASRARLTVTTAFGYSCFECVLVRLLVTHEMFVLCVPIYTCILKTI